MIDRIRINKHEADPIQRLGTRVVSIKSRLIESGGVEEQVPREEKC